MSVLNDVMPADWESIVAAWETNDAPVAADPVGVAQPDPVEWLHDRMLFWTPPV